MNRILTAAAVVALALMQGFAAAAPISIPATGLVYTQNFNTLPVAANNGTATTAWTDDATLPGWWLYRAGNGTPPGFAGANLSWRVGDGTTAPTVGQFYSIGAAGNTDRALAAPSTTSQGELSAIAIFQNNSGKTMELSRVKYLQEVRRSNDGASNVETVFVWWRVGNSLAEIRNITTGPASTSVFPAGVSTAPTSHYITGWDRLREAEYSYSNPVAAQAVNVANPVDTVPSSSIRVAPGQFFAIRFSNINDAGGDALMGIDDVELTFTDLPPGIVAVVSDTVRNNGGTPLDPADDTVDFTLRVTGSGAVSPEGWTISFPPALTGQTGDYGVPQRLTGVPVSEFTSEGHTFDALIEDQATAALWDLVTITAPWCAVTAEVLQLTRDDRGTPDFFFDDTWGYSVRVEGLFGGSGFTSDNSYVLEGDYGVTYQITGLPLAISTETTTFRDNFDSDCFAILTASAPRIVGSKEFGGGPVPLFSGDGGVPAEWVMDESALTQSMNNGGGAPAKTWRSEIVQLAGTGGAKFTASVRAVDTSAGFEAADTLNIDLVIDDTTVVDLLTTFDTNRNGVMNGGGGAADDEFNAAKAADGSYTSNFPLTYTIPSSARTAQLIVSGVTDSPNETIIIQNIKFSTGGDTDGDGMTDIYEDSNGLNKNSTADRDLDRDGDGQSNYLEFLAGSAANNPGSVLKIITGQVSGGNLSVTWHSVPGRTYRIDTSPDLTEWTDAGTDFPAAPGSAQTTAPVPLPDPVPDRYYLRVRVK